MGEGSQSSFDKRVFSFLGVTRGRFSQIPKVLKTSSA